jgi:transcriptional regulator
MMEERVMYLPAHFAETDLEAMRRLIRENPLGALVTRGAEGLTANHLPFEVATEAGPYGTLRGHVARANPVWQDGSAAHDVLVIFQGPSAYISPTWYPTKAETHQHVPTYNYAVVHVHGRLVVHDDPRWLRGVLGRLTRTMEAPRPTPWKMGDAPPDYLQEMIGRVVGIEIEATRLVGKWKVSQNRLPVDRQGAADGLRATGTPAAAAMADLILDTAIRVPPSR